MFRQKVCVTRKILRCLACQCKLTNSAQHTTCQMAAVVQVTKLLFQFSCDCHLPHMTNLCTRDLILFSLSLLCINLRNSHFQTFSMFSVLQNLPQFVSSAQNGLSNRSLVIAALCFLHFVLANAGKSQKLFQWGFSRQKREQKHSHISCIGQCSKHNFASLTLSVMTKSFLARASSSVVLRAL